MAKAPVVSVLSLLLSPLLFAQFQTHVDYPVGAQPFSVATGDFNGDGKPDLAVTNSADNTVSILLGNGEGTFQPQVAYATNTRPTSVVVGDFNGDGKLDLAITCSGANVLSILIGNGDGTFQPHVDYATDANPQFLVVADFNGDGHSDVATANYGLDYSGGSVGVYLGKGDGTFRFQGNYGGGVNPFGIMAGDFNHDGKADLAVVDNNGSYGVSILLGNGDGSFQSPGWYATGENPRKGVVGDFNGDGSPDLAIGNCIDDNLSVLLGDGLGHFAAPANYGVGSYVQAVAAGDFNLDEKLDLVATNSGSSSVSVLLGNGDRTFQGHVDYSTGGGPMGVAVADLNSDGAPDIVTANYYAGTVSVLLNALRNTTTTLSSSLNPAAPSQVVSYTATVTSKRENETGSVAFKDGGLTVSTVPLANHKAVYATRYTGAGAHPMTATYSGDSQNTESTSSVLTEYIQGGTSTVVATSGSPSLIGQPVTFSAAVTSRFGQVPDCALVTFYDGTSPMGTSPLSQGTALYTTSALVAKPHNIKATFSGTQSFKTSTGWVSQLVNKYAASIALGSSRNASNYGQNVTLTATVTSKAATPTGTVTFRDGTTWFGMATLNASGVATLTKNTLVVGPHSITATYNGDSQNAGGTSAPIIVKVSQAVTHTSILSSVNPSKSGQTVYFTAAVISPTTKPTGTVTFMDGSIALSTLPLSGVAKAVYGTAALSAGTHNITVIYNGTENIKGSTSPLFVQIVN